MPEIPVQGNKSADQVFGLTAWIGILFGILIGIAKAFIWSRGAFDSEIFGYAIAAILVPAQSPMQ